MTAAAKPGRLVGGGAPNFCVHERAFKEGGAAWAAVVATRAQNLMHGVRLVVVVALHSCVARRLRRRSRLDELAGKVVGLMPGAQVGFPVGFLVVATRGVLMGLPVGLLVGTLGTGDCCCMERVICLLSLIWGLGTLGGACTLGARCMLRVLSGLWFPQI
jgi:hypothetical protein